MEAEKQVKDRTRYSPTRTTSRRAGAVLTPSPGSKVKLLARPAEQVAIRTLTGPQGPPEQDRKPEAGTAEAVSAVMTTGAKLGPPEPPTVVVPVAAVVLTQLVEAPLVQLVVPMAARAVLAEVAAALVTLVEPVEPVTAVVLLGRLEQLVHRRYAHPCGGRVLTIGSGGIISTDGGAGGAGGNGSGVADPGCGGGGSGGGRVIIVHKGTLTNNGTGHVDGGAGGAKGTGGDGTGRPGGAGGAGTTQIVPVV